MQPEKYNNYIRIALVVPFKFNFDCFISLIWLYNKYFIVGLFVSKAFIQEKISALLDLV